MTFETIKFGLFLTLIPFSVIFLFIAVCWTLVDTSASVTPHNLHPDGDSPEACTAD